MNITSNPSTVHPPLGQYAHVVEVPDNARWLVISGQVGIDHKGKLATNARKQSEQALRNILACLRDHGMNKRDLVKTTVYLTDPRFIDDFRAARKKVMGSALYTNTMVIIDGLATPDIVVEIEAWAAGRQGTQSK